MHSSGLSFAVPDAEIKQTEHVGVFEEGTSLIAAVRISGHGAVYGLETVVARTGEKTGVAQCW